MLAMFLAGSFHGSSDSSPVVGVRNDLRRRPVRSPEEAGGDFTEAPLSGADDEIGRRRGPRPGEEEAGPDDGPAQLPEQAEARPLMGSSFRRRSPASAGGGSDDCGFISFLLCRYIDIDFIEFVLTSHPKPTAAKIVDIGVFQAGELLQMARTGFEIDAYEPNPFRYEKATEEIAAQPANVKQRITLHQNAVADRKSKLYFQRAGLDSHIYFPEDETKLKEHTIIVDGIPIADIVREDKYFVKIDTQGFDTRIVDNLLDALDKNGKVVTFLQFEFTPYFEVTRAHRTKEDHKKVFRRLLDAGYDIYQGAAVQPWIKSHRSQYGKTPLSMISPAANVPTCIEEFVEFMHAGKQKAIHPGKTSTDMGTWMDILAVKRLTSTPYYRHTGWVLSRHM
jgi:FkbM family methyltransferase